MSLTFRFLASFSLSAGTHTKAIGLSAGEKLSCYPTAGLVAMVDLVLPLGLLLVHESAVLRWVVSTDVYWLP